MGYLILLSLSLSLTLVSCGRGDSSNYYCNKEQLEILEKLVNECSKETLNNKRACWQTMVKNVCTYKL
jgi:hypothetical protein